jgi:hypothetical protein
MPPLVATTMMRACSRTRMVEERASRRSVPRKLKGLPPEEEPVALVE